MEEAILDFLHYEIMKVYFERLATDTDDVTAEMKFITQENKEDSSMRRVTLHFVASGAIKAEIVLAGIFKINESYPENYEGTNALEVIAGSILIPYVRSLLSFISSADGSKPIIIPAINLNNLYSVNKDDSNGDNA